jgi:hypothetical protein
VITLKFSGWIRGDIDSFLTQDAEKLICAKGIHPLPNTSIAHTYLFNHSFDDPYVKKIISMSERIRNEETV